jgi:hypothetical protein
MTKTIRLNIGLLTLLTGAIALATSPNTVAQTNDQRVVSFETPRVSLRAIPISSTNKSHIASFQIELVSSAPTEARLRLFVDNPSGKEVYSNSFPEVISLRNAGTTYSRTWHITNNATTTSIGAGINSFGFECLDITNKFRIAESLPLNVVVTPTKPPMPSPFPSRKAHELPPRIDLKVVGNPSNSTNSSKLCSFNIEVRSSLTTTSSLKLTVQNETGTPVYSITYPQPINTFSSRTTVIPWSIPNDSQTQNIKDGRNFFIFEIKDKSGLIKREETIPVYIKTKKPTPTPNPPFVYSPGLILEDSFKKDVPVKVEQIPLSENGHQLIKNLNYYGWDTTYTIFVLKLSADKDYWLDNKNTVGGNAKAKLHSWIKNVLLKNYKIDQENQLVEGNSVISELFGYKYKDDAISGLKAYGDFKDEFFDSSIRKQISLDNPILSLHSSIDSFTHRFFTFIPLDTTPFQSPGREDYFVVIEAIYSE